MNVRITIGKGVTGAVRYCLGEGRHPVTGELLPKRADGSARVEWIGGTGFSFPVRTLADIERARILMELDAQNQPVRRGGWRCEQDCVHLVLAWRPGEHPTRKDVEDSAKDALAALGMENAKALFFVHNDEDYAHIHIVASKINPATGRAYDLKGNYLILSRWAEQYEREHGGVINLRRADMNELRAAIRDRDAGAVLECMTRQRPTITGDQVRRALQKEIWAPRGASVAQKQSVEVDRSRFQARILAHPDVLRLREDTPSGPMIRYTTRTVLEAEQHVLRAAVDLASASGHDVGDQYRAQIEGSTKFATMTPEQLRAFRHATAAGGLALIDGQAGTGKSYTIAAIREAYEVVRYRVIGLAPTNAVAEDMRNDGFGHAATIHAELFALANGRAAWTRETAVIVDEAAMVETAIMALLATWAAEAGAKLILAGDDRQLSSINRGGMFGVLKELYGAAMLSDVKRQYKIDERRASQMMAEGNFHDALGIYERKGAIHWTRTQPEARALLVEQWANDTAAAPDKSRFVFAYTNDAVRDLNAALRAVRKRMNSWNRAPATTNTKTAAAAPTRQPQPSRKPPARASRPTTHRCNIAAGQGGKSAEPPPRLAGARRTAEDEGEAEVIRDETAGPQSQPRRNRRKSLSRKRLAKSWHAHLRAGWRIAAAWVTLAFEPPATGRPTRRTHRGRQHRPQKPRR
jgi:AAA domain/Relaxase/Mobilisation nuclease domain